MKHTISICIIFVISLLSGCSEENIDATELEGSWASSCRDGELNTINFFNNPTGSSKFIYQFEGNKVTEKVAMYSDKNCVQATKTVNFDDENFIVFPGTEFYRTFTIGNTITTSDDVNAVEIDFYADNNIYLNIYTINKETNTLYFGIACPVEAINVGPCVNDRPNQLIDQLAYNKIN